MSLFRHALANAKLTIIALTFSSILLFLIALIATVGLITQPNRIRVFVPPQIPAQGILLHQNTVSPEQVYAFTYYIWSIANHWQTDGQKEYPANIKQLHPYLTTNFYNFLLSDASQRDKGGELSSRMRTLVGLDANAYQAQDVRAMPDGTWIVALTMHLTETIAEKTGEIHVVKDVVMQYFFSVVKDNDAANPWGLAIDNFVQEPKRLSTSV